MLLSTSWTRSRVSALMAACDGEVSRPSNWAASEPELAAGIGPRCSETSWLASRIRPQVAAMGIDQLLAGDVPQPEEERQRPVRQVIRKSLGGFEIGLLEDVRVVDAALELPVEAEADHLLEPLAIAGEELGQAVSSPAAAWTSSWGRSADSGMAVTPMRNAIHLYNIASRVPFGAAIPGRRHGIGLDSRFSRDCESGCVPWLPHCTPRGGHVRPRPRRPTRRGTSVRVRARDVELVGEDRAAGLVAVCNAQAGVVAGLQRQVADRGPAGALE